MVEVAVLKLVMVVLVQQVQAIYLEIVVVEWMVVVGR